MFRIWISTNIYFIDSDSYMGLYSVLERYQPVLAGIFIKEYL
ncbi:Uncharacterized protein dnm_094080 [Desulfonema magnum]|uniref:Uncharacterized protein n=1 Tax=Desulfonema magnum TaxID=45655 RepID=A0A975BWZ9_9BACT|nr:Uncharacterized protein dnm_094080 [Desulfonema magnum]